MTGYFSDIWRLRHFWMALVKIDLRPTLSRHGHRHRLVALAADRHDRRSLSGFLRDVRAGSPRFRALSADRIDILGIHHGHRDARLHVLLSRRIVHPPASRSAGDISVAADLGRGLPFPARNGHYARLRLVRQRIRQSADDRRSDTRVYDLVRRRLGRWRFAWAWRTFFFRTRST